MKSDWTGSSSLGQTHFPLAKSSPIRRNSSSKARRDGQRRAMPGRFGSARRVASRRTAQGTGGTLNLVALPIKFSLRARSECGRLCSRLASAFVVCRGRGAWGISSVLGTRPLGNVVRRIDLMRGDLNDSAMTSNAGLLAGSRKHISTVAHHAPRGPAECSVALDRSHC
jgi:hypothetical protein